MLKTAWYFFVETDELFLKITVLTWNAVFCKQCKSRCWHFSIYLYIKFTIPILIIVNLKSSFVNNVKR